MKPSAMRGLPQPAIRRVDKDKAVPGGKARALGQQMRQHKVALQAIKSPKKGQNLAGTGPAR